MRPDTAGGGERAERSLRQPVIVQFDGYETDDDPARVDHAVLWSFLSTEAYWGRGRTREDIERQLASAWRIVAAYEQTTGRMAGFARAVSDGVALADVYVTKEERGQGLGTQIVRVMIECGAAWRFRWMLHTSDVHGLYGKFGFGRPDDT